MRASWADAVADSSPAAPTATATSAHSYVPPHLRNRPPSSDPPAPRCGPPPPNRASFGGTRSTGGWGGSSTAYESNPFSNDVETSGDEPAFDAENTGINFDAYEDIPVEAHGQDVPPPVNSFDDIDLGDALNENIRRCKYVRPISLFGAAVRHPDLARRAGPDGVRADGVREDGGLLLPDY